MSKPVFKILFGTVLIGKVQTKSEFAELLDRLENDMCKLSFIASVASLLPNEKFEELMSRNIPKLKSLKRLTIPTESYELYRAWVKLNENSPVALVYSADDRPTASRSLQKQSMERLSARAKLKPQKPTKR